MMTKEVRDALDVLVRHGLDFVLIDFSQDEVSLYFKDYENGCKKLIKHFGFATKEDVEEAVRKVIREDEDPYGLFSGEEQL